MNELTGEDAFDRVLERMVDAEKRAAITEESTRGSRYEIAALLQSLNNTRSDLTTTKVRLERFLQSDGAFTALYDAIEEAIRTLGGGSEAATSLRAKMVEAKKFVDPIPF